MAKLKDNMLSVFVFPMLLTLTAAPASAETPPVAIAEPAAISATPLAPVDAPIAPAAVAAPEATAPVTADPVATAESAPAAPSPNTTDDPDAIIVTARGAPPPEDPLRGANAVSFAVIQTVDQNFVAPIAMAYKSSFPVPVRDGARNFLYNLQEPVVFINYLLQLKPGKAAETFGRFVVNSTLGVAGLVDVAKKPPFNLPRRNNGFAYTMGYYGIKSGPYLFLPLIGPTTLRDVIGRSIDLLVLPALLAKPFSTPAWTLSTTAVRSLDDRVEADPVLRQLNAQSDPYAAQREAYLTKRQIQLDALKGLPKAAPIVAPPAVTPVPDTKDQVGLQPN